MFIRIVSVSSDGSDETVHMHSLVGASASRIHKVWEQRRAQIKTRGDQLEIMFSVYRNSVHKGFFLSKQTL